MAKKTLNIGMIGYGFMGRAHSNGYLRAKAASSRRTPNQATLR